MQEFFKNVGKIFSSFNAVDALVILLFTLIFYYVFRILKSTNVRSVMVVFISLIVGTGIVFMSDKQFRGEAYIIVPLLLAGIVLVIFNVEVKRDILNMNTFAIHNEKQGHQTAV